MKIGQPEAPAAPPGGAATRVAGEAGKADNAKAPAAGGVEPSAQVQLSEAASVLLGAGAADFDAEKVARISRALADGTYQVNAEAIADKLIANAQELLGKVKN